jgi:hypothetical protein
LNQSGSGWQVRPMQIAAISFINAAGKWLLAGYPHFLTEKLRNDSLKLSKNDPSYPVLCFLAGEVRRAAGRSEEAKKCFDAAYAGSIKIEGLKLLTLLAASRRSNLAHMRATQLDRRRCRFPHRGGNIIMAGATVEPEDERFVMKRFCSEDLLKTAGNCPDQLRLIYKNSKLPKWDGTDA